MNLNIIGNGFDLYHGFPSSYYYFGSYIIKNDPEFYEQFAKMYNFRYLKPIGPQIAHEFEYMVEDIFWRNFEEHLGEIDDFFIVDTYETDLHLECNDPVDIEMNEDEIAETLKHYFTKWVMDTLDKDENYDIILEELKNIYNEIFFNKDDYFMVFNYTHTLQRLYKISDDRIHYVHGECIGEEDELIIGHGNSQRIDKIINHIEMLMEENYYTQAWRNNINEYKCLLRYLERLKKDVNTHMMECNIFYNKIYGDLNYINVYGLSLGEVDIPYLKQIREKWPKSKWRFSYYSSQDKVRISDVVTKSLNLNKEEYRIFSFFNPISKGIRDKIIKKQNIISY